MVVFLVFVGYVLGICFVVDFRVYFIDLGLWGYFSFGNRRNFCGWWLVFVGKVFFFVRVGVWVR